MLDRLIEHECSRQLLHDGLATLTRMDDETRTAYCGEWDEWDATPLHEPD